MRKHTAHAPHMGKKGPPKGTVHRKDHRSNGKKGGGKKTSKLEGMKI